VLPSGRESRVARIVTYDGDLDEAAAGKSVTLTLEDEIDISRGDVIATADAPPEVADQFETHILWMSPKHMLPGRPYIMKIGAKTATCTPASPKYKIHVDTLEHLAAKSLELNEIGVCNISLDREIAFDSYAENRETGSFILIDRLSNETVGMGLLHFALRRAANIHRQAMKIDKATRAEQKNQKPAILWFTGLSGSGKSTIADIVSQKLHTLNRHTATLDGDNVRHGLNRDLGFTDVDRVENIRRIAEVSKLMVEAGLIVITSFISPFRAERQMARSLVDSDEFVEIFVDTPLEIAESRDVKGLYKKARAGQIKNFTGIDSPYEAPRAAEITVDTARMSAEEAAGHIVEWLEERGYLG
jgi:bifunctional enzyme CysN/CysC